MIYNARAVGYDVPDGTIMLFICQTAGDLMASRYGDFMLTVGRMLNKPLSQQVSQKEHSKVQVSNISINM